MCEANAYLKNSEGEALFMEAVDIIEPYEDGLKLVDIFGRQKFIRARIKDMTLLSHRIVLEAEEGRRPAPHAVVSTAQTDRADILAR
ncbi:Predicted RNA-binding protein [Acididesulfobacillus acetoxydans]|uniref:Predicted RNA-binding protein n=1 Tax=Acididesulfobacillus acetoxydans TaxID=1561005 RepID=A0A8S0WF50_9FIRM|nr:CooT family nickel-binding protein [Acididesulfobacillus acetoxydans]CAA7600672.1 Predicted RNA-binding protein [Acididesulfobacillus acetoxydans]CEJ09453.1 Predicted RNA-binding protein [Acididesulfobacillus acetoxydans]